jgi:uncharacterized protein YjbI with pentapeptide repeats
MELIRDSELRNLLLEGKIEEFNRLTEEEPPDLESVDLRTVDLRGANLLHARLRDSYLRNADLRGVDLLYADMDGASIQGARVSGVRFPRDLTAEEIQLSLRDGTRLRAQRDPAPPAEENSSS